MGVLGGSRIVGSMGVPRSKSGDLRAVWLWSLVPARRSRPQFPLPPYPCELGQDGGGAHGEMEGAKGTAHGHTPCEAERTCVLPCSLGASG